MSQKLCMAKFRLIFLLSSALTVVLVIGFFSLAQAASPPPDYTLPSMQDNSACLGCHTQPGMTMTFPNGEKLSVTLDQDAYLKSVHGWLGCDCCHPGYDSFPHPKTSAKSLKEYSLSFHDSCQLCHPNQFEMVSGSVHEELLMAGNLDTPTCVDCHQPHQQVRISQLGDYPGSPYGHSPEICATCHQEAYETYAESIHGSQLLAGNHDMPTCIDCHSIHEIYNPREGAFRKDSIDMCVKCHADPSIMDKYDLSANVLDTYVVFHNTTVTLLEKYDPDSLTNKPTCYDCHGIHDVTESSPPTLALSMIGSDQYAPVVAEASPPPVSRVGFTGTVVGFLLGCIGTLTVTQLLKERSQEKKGEEKANGGQE